MIYALGNYESKKGERLQSFLNDIANDLADRERDDFEASFGGYYTAKDEYIELSEEAVNQCVGYVEAAAREEIEERASWKAHIKSYSRRE